jgi:hypothetical protein
VGRQSLCTWWRERVLRNRSPDRSRRGVVGQPFVCINDHRIAGKRDWRMNQLSYSFCIPLETDTMFVSVTLSVATYAWRQLVRDQGRPRGMAFVTRMPALQAEQRRETQWHGGAAKSGPKMRGLYLH